MEPQKGEFELNDHGRPDTGWGYQIERDEDAETARRPLRRKEDDARSRARVREQVKHDPELLVHVLTAADPRAEYPGQGSRLALWALFEADSGAVAARAGLFEYALLPSDHRKCAPPIMFPLGSFLPSWGGVIEFDVHEPDLRDPADTHKVSEGCRPFGDDPLQGYTRKKVNISGAVAIAMKGEALPDEKMLAIIDIGGGARIGLRKTELTKPENVVKVKPLEKEVLSRWRVGKQKEGQQKDRVRASLSRRATWRAA